MGRVKTIARRTFLIGSAAIAGGVAFGYYAYVRPLHNPLLDDLAEGEAAITPFVKIDANGVTLITPRADVGQGAMAIQAMLLAEELDVDPAKVRLSPGDPAPAYYNRAVLEESIPFAATDQGWLAKSARQFTQVPAKWLGLQITGGSSTVPDMYVRLREAGAVARETLKQAASEKTGIAREKLRTSDGAVLLPDGTSITYSELAPLAAKLQPVSDVAVRPESEWRYLGRKFERIDIVAKSTGTQNYGIDMQLDGMAFATARTNPGRGGGVKSMNTAEAEKMRGVEKIVPIRNGVAVVADNTWRAFQAANAIDIEWEPAPYPATSDEMWEKVSASFTPGHLDSRFKDDGDVEVALTGDGMVEAEYRIPYLAHAPLEPLNATVLATDDRLDIWTGTQIPQFMRWHISDLTGLPESSVHIHALPSGGSFGLRLEDAYALQAVEIAMAMKGRPVKMTWTREEDMTQDFPRPMQMARGRGAARNGKVEAFDLSIASQSVSVSQIGRVLLEPPGPDITTVAGAWDQPFAIPNCRVSGYRVPEMVPVSSWRSVGASGNGFFHACFFDELCEAAGVDPFDEMLRLCSDEVSRKVIERAKEISGWSGRRIEDNRGRGVAFCLSFGVPVAQVVEVTNLPTGIRLDRAFLVADVGKVLDPVNAEAQLTGGFIWGAGHAMNCEMTFDNHAAEQTNFHVYESMRLYQVPTITVDILENGEKVRGLGEPGVPPAAPALANAIFAATGKRIRELPLNRHVDFV
jgi:isoquinoline 1-oxidoreductase beta subunit